MGSLFHHEGQGTASTSSAAEQGTSKLKVILTVEGYMGQADQVGKALPNVRSFLPYQALG